MTSNMTKKSKATAVKPQFPYLAPRAEDIKRILSLGLSLHQQGRLEQARAYYQQVLSLQPEHFDANYLIGLVYAQGGNAQMALEFLRKVTLLKPDFVDAYYNLGVIAERAELLEEAAKNLQKVVSLRPDYPMAHNNLGVVFQRQGHLKSALESFGKEIHLYPNNAEAYNNRANVYKELSQNGLALSDYEQAIKLNPGYAQAHCNRGQLLAKQERYQEAIASFDQAIAIDPLYADAYTSRGNAQLELLLFEQALASHNKAIEINPNFAEAYCSRGLALQELKQFEEALNSYDKAIALKADYADAYNNRGVALKDLLRIDEALASYDKAITFKPDFTEAFTNRGNVLQDLKRMNEALASYDMALALKPDYAKAILSKSLLLLLMGDYLPGWELYEWRLQKNGRKDVYNSPDKLSWRGQADLRGKSLLIHGEQGLGDLIQFCRYLPQLQSLGARLIFEVPKPLVSLISTLKCDMNVVAKGSELPYFDAYCPVMSLPMVFKTTLETIPAEIPYLFADASKKQAWEERLGKKKKPRIGVVWSSVSSFKNDSLRSMKLEQFIKCVPVDEYEVICLQKIIKDEDQALFKTLDGQIKYFGDKLEDFADTAALASCMDMVLSTCTSVPHMTAAMGVPTWVLLSYSPDFRWLLNRDDSPWYPGAKLVRQPTLGDWDSVLEAIRADLSNLNLSTVSPFHKEPQQI